MPLVPGMSPSRLALAAACLLTASCTPHGQEPQEFEGNATRAYYLRCDEGVVSEPSEGQKVGDGVTLASSFTAEEAGRADGLLFAKGGLWVRSGSSARLTLTLPSSALASWGKPGRPSRQVVVPPCSGPGWHVWPGGFYVDGPSTVHLLVETAHAKATGMVAVAGSRGERSAVK